MVKEGSPEVNILLKLHFTHLQLPLTSQCYAHDERCPTHLTQLIPSFSAFSSLLLASCQVIPAPSPGQPQLLLPLISQPAQSLDEVQLWLLILSLPLHLSASSLTWTFQIVTLYPQYIIEPPNRLIYVPYTLASSPFIAAISHTVPCSHPKVPLCTLYTQKTLS